MVPNVCRGFDGLGFTLNEYDACVANLEVEGSQCTVCWYVDRNKISHKNPEVVDWVIKELEKRFDKVTVTRGRQHSPLPLIFRIFSAPAPAHFSKFSPLPLPLPLISQNFLRSRSRSRSFSKFSPLPLPLPLI